jgi:hypothetical protein
LNSQIGGHQRRCAFECIRFVLHSDELDEPDRLTRIGASCDEIEAVLARWPDVADDDPGSLDHVIVNNAFNEVCHGIDIDKETWMKWFSVSPAEVAEAYRAWSDRAT